MISRIQRIVIALLIPAAIGAVAFAVYAYFGVYLPEKEKAEKAELESEYRKRQAEYYEGQVKRSQDRKAGDQTPETKKEPDGGGEDGALVLLKPDAIAAMSESEQQKYAGILLAVFKDKSSSPREFAAAYASLLNFREHAPAILASWLKDENDPFVIYVALKACLELKSIYAIDGVAPETDFLDLSLGAHEKADAAGKYCVAQLLGFYRDQRARDILVKMLEADDSTLVYFALLSLGRIGAPAEVPKLVLFLNSPDKALVAAACRALDALLNYDAGQDVTFLPDYKQALDDKARQWLAWWREHSREFPEGN